MSAASEAIGALRALQAELDRVEDALRVRPELVLLAPSGPLAAILRAVASKLVLRALERMEAAGELADAPEHHAQRLHLRSGDTIVFMRPASPESASDTIAEVLTTPPEPASPER